MLSTKLNPQALARRPAAVAGRRAAVQCRALFSNVFGGAKAGSGSGSGSEFYNFTVKVCARCHVHCMPCSLAEMEPFDCGTRREVERCSSARVASGLPASALANARRTPASENTANGHTSEHPYA